MKTIIISIFLLITLQSFMVNGQIIVKESQSEPYVYVFKTHTKDTILVDSLLVGISQFEKVFVQQTRVYKYSNGFTTDAEEYFMLQEFSIENNHLKLLSTNSVSSADYKKLFLSGLTISINEEGICFKVPNYYCGSITLPFDLYIDKKKMDCFFRFLSKIIT